MEKILTIFERDWEGDRSRVLNQPVPDCAWVFEGFGVPTRKYDGTCVMFDGHAWWARREVKGGKQAPANFVSVSHDDETGKTVGWEPIEQSPFAKFHAEAVADEMFPDWTSGTYELIGPKVQGNPEGTAAHMLVRHSAAEEVICPTRTFDAIKAVLEVQPIEGIVFHNADGRMGKIKKRDFGLKR
jgi:hypothetical protein